MIIHLGRAARARLQPVLDGMVLVIVCFATGHAVASVALWLVSLPLGPSGMEMADTTWAFFRWGLGLVLVAVALSKRMGGE
ncbi:hypothetical protein ACLF3G_13525 [Falsiroseomonas sp. HC035]|uniref:hypothetical protein n=1 Tax=Falsiroseomonas sp. HC035 TaxID=3390999 RepID=UPI003D322AE8